MIIQRSLVSIHGDCAPNLRFMSMTRRIIDAQVLLGMTHALHSIKVIERLGDPGGKSVLNRTKDYQLKNHMLLGYSGPMHPVRGLF